MTGAGSARPAMAWRLVRHAVLGSTNDEALARARAGEPEGMVVTAERQEAARGRQGRRWQSPAGNLAASLVLRPARPSAEWASLSLVAAVALAEALPVPSRLKWPNDVQVDGAKISGILLESDGQGAVVLGIGVNVAHKPEGVPYPVTALADHGATLAPEALLERLLARFGERYADWTAGGFAAVREAWLTRGHRAGEALRVSGHGDGRFAGLDADGALLLEQSQGVVRVTAGDLTSPD